MQEKITFSAKLPQKTSYSRQLLTKPMQYNTIKDFCIDQGTSLGWQLIPIAAF